VTAIVEEWYNTDDVADEIDWVKGGAVTPVKNQARCGSCWAFSSTGALEGANFVVTKELVSLSEQQLVDCSKDNNGCDGGLMDYAFKYTETNALETEDDYPYQGVDADCKFSQEKGKVKASGYRDVPRNEPEQLKAALN
jgi:cathepsin L